MCIRDSNNTDTVKVNDKSVYPMMSVFKVHQALAPVSYTHLQRPSSLYGVSEGTTALRDE